MQYSQELYQEYLKTKEETKANRGANANASRFQNMSGVSVNASRQGDRRRGILEDIVDLPDDITLTLDSSILLMRELGIISSIRSIEHLCELSEYKKRTGELWEETEVELWECRLISFLWGVLEEETVEIRQFKEVLMILLNHRSRSRDRQMEEIFGQKEEISQLIWAWDHLFAEEGEEEEDDDEEEEEDEEYIQDMSIIKTKNEGLFKHKENIPNCQNTGYQTDRAQSQQHPSKLTKPRQRLQKSFQKKTAQTNIDRSSSRCQMTSKRSECNSVQNHLGMRPVSNFYREIESLNMDDEKRLVQRLYKCDKFKEREEQKKILDRERVQNEMRQCTFKPKISGKESKMEVKGIKREKNREDKQAKGYQQAIERMKKGYTQSQELKENRELRQWKRAGHFNGKLTQCNPPKFHSRSQKQPQNQLFELKFIFGKMTIPIKIRESDQIENIVSNITRIYSLKEEEKSYIRTSLLEECEKYLTRFCQPAAQV